MSKRQFKVQASSSRAVPGASFGGFGSPASGSILSYLTEPPNLSAISDANVVVAFKNLSKKDGTTKSKALEDLRTYVLAHPHEQDGGVEDAVLEAWVKFYPRISIDNSRRVRELSHNLQYELLKSARKRMEKYIPKIVGSWLGGTYDRDRAVARAANDGTKSFLDTQAKMVIFYRRCEAPILEYAREALEEKPQTLSDERTMSLDDMQAKYFRVIGSSLSLVTNLLSTLDYADILKHQDKYEAILSGNKKLWSFASGDDAFVRRAASQLLAISLAKLPVVIESDLEVISHAFIAEGLKSSQTSSALQLLDVLDALTSKYPQVWTSSYKAKKGPLSRLRTFIEKGSQGGPPDYWTKLSSVVLRLPDGVFPSEPDSLLDILTAYRNGVSNREESRTNAPVAWASYFDVAGHFNSLLSPADVQEKLLPEGIFPVFEQYLHPTSANNTWAIGNNISTLAKALRICLSSKGDSKATLEAEWARLEKDFLSKILTSLPEQSKDYHSSQAAVIAISHRWFKLLAEVIQSQQQESIDLITPSSHSIIKTCLDLVVNRNGKPYSAAATVETVLRLTPSVIENSPDNLFVLKSFLESYMADLVLSPSGPYLISILNLFRSLPGQEVTFKIIWESTIDGLLALPEDSKQSQAVAVLIADDSVSNIAQNNSALQEFILRGSSNAVQGNINGRNLFEAAVASNSLLFSTSEQLLDQILASLDVRNPGLDGALKSLEFVLKNRPGLLSSQSNIHVTLITKLLGLTELTSSPIASRATALRSAIEKSINSAESKGLQHSSTIHVIRENLENAGPQSLTIETLVQQAKNFIAQAPQAPHAAIFPDAKLWLEFLGPLLGQIPNPALGVMRPFAGTVFLVKQSSTKNVPRPARDINGYSIPLRMALYTSSVLLHEDLSQGLPDDLQVQLYYLLALSYELANDQVDLLEDNKLFASHQDLDTINDVRKFLRDFREILNDTAENATSWRAPVFEKQMAEDKSAVIHALILKLIESSSAESPSAYYASKALGSLIQALVSTHGWHNDGSEEWLSSLGILKTSTNNTLGAAAICIGLEDNVRSSKFVSTLCNQLISDISGAKARSENTLDLIVLLNSVLAVYDDDDLPVAKNRLIFAVREILSWTEGLPTADSRLASEACRALQKLLPAIRDVYGTYWETTFEFCVSIWESSNDGALSNERLPMIGMSLKLFSILQNMREDEGANDDLKEAYDFSHKKACDGLVSLLKLDRLKETQPLEFVDGLLSRQATKIPSSRIKDLTEFYPLVASEFRMVQSAAFDVLHKALPQVQQELSVNVLLEGTTAQLPLELLSLLLNKPSPQDVSETNDFPSSIRGYLLSWLIIYESYKTASLKVRNDYSELLKAENYVGPLLNFMFIMLGHSDANPLNLDRARFDSSMIRNYDMRRANDSEPPERSMNWLLVNLYYLCLVYTPALVRTWRFDCDSRQTGLAVDSWTRRFFTPLVVEDTLEEVEKWSSNQDIPSEDGKELIIKVSKRSREIFAGYEIDELTMQIVIRFPENYPLEGVIVEGLNRVAVSEKKWLSWLRNTKGVITFSHGSIIDGLTAFQKNVTGALKGHTECAICYSIIGPDKKTPDKRCGTCNNLFHSNCLYKWFSSSNQSTCPLCRNPFNYGLDSARRRAG
ncbi:C3HC4 type (RING finger) zinc finger containing protein [Diplocarpon rosae]|nr:C3HC4 type (RING finger) zinc finger containing protein [Diplocarpon rosae]